MEVNSWDTFSRRIPLPGARRVSVELDDIDGTEGEIDDLVEIGVEAL